MADAVIVWASSYQSVKCREAKRWIDSLACALWEVTLNDLNFAPQVLECATIDDKHISKWPWLPNSHIPWDYFPD